MPSTVKWSEETNTFMRITKVSENRIDVEPIDMETYLKEKGW